MRNRLVSALDRYAGRRLLAALLVVIFALSSIPNQIQAPSSTNLDKIPHAIEYGVLAIVAAWLFGPRERLAPRAAALAVAFAVAVGAADETYQRLIPGRDPSWQDLAADAAGAIIGVVAAAWLARAGGRPAAQGTP